jgi:hypothetical protein
MGRKIHWVFHILITLQFKKFLVTNSLSFKMSFSEMMAIIDRSSFLQFATQAKLKCY